MTRDSASGQLNGLKEKGTWGEGGRKEGEGGGGRRGRGGGVGGRRTKRKFIVEFYLHNCPRQIWNFNK